MNTEINNILSRLNDSINLDNKLLISIILPVYNTEKYLNRCLDSIFLQQENDLEVIIVNDCSPNTDLCRDIVHSYINNSYNVIYIENKENLGSAWSRLNDLSYARGKYIHFVDSDDWLHKDSYKIIKKYLKKNYDLLYFNGEYASDDRTWEFDFHISGDYTRYGKRVAFDDMFFNDAQGRTLWCRVFKRSLAIQGGCNMPREKTSVADDWILNLFILFFSRNYRSISDKLYYYYQDNPNAVTSIVENKKNNRISFYKLNNTIRQVYISYNSVVTFLKKYKVWHIYRVSWVLYITRDLKYSFIEPLKNFDKYFNDLIVKDKDQYIKESIEYFDSNLSNLNILNFIYNNLLDSSGIWEKNMFKYFLISYFYKIFKSLTRIRNYPNALFSINVTKTKEHRRMYIKFLFFKLTLKLKSKEN